LHEELERFFISLRADQRDAAFVADGRRAPLVS
jgi:hypothetical protein